MIGDQYIVSGMGTMALNTTHPSPLDENHIKYLIHLTPDLLPEMEELIVPGPLAQEINVQVRRGKQTFTSDVTLGFKRCFFFSI